MSIEKSSLRFVELVELAAGRFLLLSNSSASGFCSGFFGGDVLSMLRFLKFDFISSLILECFFERTVLLLFFGYFWLFLVFLEDFREKSRYRVLKVEITANPNYVSVDSKTSLF